MTTETQCLDGRDSPEPHHREKAQQEGADGEVGDYCMVFADQVGKAYESLGLVMGMRCGTILL